MTDYFAHALALVESAHIGKNTRIWAFAHVLSGAVVGEDCNLCDHVFIENEVVIGDRVTVKCGVQLWNGVTLEDDVFVGPNATFSNDLFPRSKHPPQAYARTLVRKGASIGANATILPGLAIGQYAMVGAGTVVTKDVPPFAIVVGNPATIVGYVNADKLPAKPAPDAASLVPNDQQLAVKGVRLCYLPSIVDLRGSLSFAEFPNGLPFVPRRYFVVHAVPSKEVRGAHAHRHCEQFLICVSGRCSVVVEDGENRSETILDRPNLGLYVPPMIWSIEYKYSPDAVLLVLASDIYDAADYIRDYDQFLTELHAHV